VWRSNDNVLSEGVNERVSISVNQDIQNAAWLVTLEGCTHTQTHGILQQVTAAARRIIIQDISLSPSSPPPSTSCMHTPSFLSTTTVPNSAETNQEEAQALAAALHATG
jgi:hypothetical protein